MENPVSQPADAGDGVTRASTVASVTRINLDLVRRGFRQKSKNNFHLRTDVQFYNVTIMVLEVG